MDVSWEASAHAPWQDDRLEGVPQDRDEEQEADHRGADMHGCKSITTGALMAPW